MGIYDRDYYREDTRWSNPFARSKGTIFLVLLYAFTFVAQVANRVDAREKIGEDPLTPNMQLDVKKTLAGEAWRVGSYALLHQSEPIFHVVFTCVFLIWIGHQVEDLYGTKEYLCFYVFTSLLGGIAYTSVGAFAENTPHLIGPSGAVTAVLILFALHYPALADALFPDLDRGCVPCLCGHRWDSKRTGQSGEDLRPFGWCQLRISVPFVLFACIALVAGQPQFRKFYSTSLAAPLARPAARSRTGTRHGEHGKRWLAACPCPRPSGQRAFGSEAGRGTRKGTEARQRQPDGRRTRDLAACQRNLQKTSAIQLKVSSECQFTIMPATIAERSSRSSFARKRKPQTWIVPGAVGYTSIVS